MKKSLVWALIGAMTMTSLSGCASNKRTTVASGEISETKEEVIEVENKEEIIETEPEMDLGGRTIKIGAWWNLAPNPETERGEKALAKKQNIEETYNCKIEFVNTDEVAATADILTTSTLAGDPVVDITYLDIRYFPNLAAKGIIQPLEELANVDIENEMWDEAAKQASNYKGHIYGVDNEREAKCGVFYNKRMFEEAGLPDLYELQRSGEWTWEKLEEYAKKLTIDKNGDGVIDQYGIVDTDVSLALQLIYSNEAEPITFDGTTPKIEIDSENSMEALQMYDKLANQLGVAYKRESGMPWDFQMAAFREGKVAVLPYERYAVGSFKEMEDDFGWVMFPKGPQADDYRSLLLSINIQVMSSAVKNPEEVAFIMKKWNEPDADETPDSWKDRYYNSYRDSYAVDETLTWQMRGGKSVFGTYNLFDVYDILNKGLILPISKGEITAAAGIESIKPQLQSKLDEFMAQ